MVLMLGCGPGASDSGVDGTDGEADATTGTDAASDSTVPGSDATVGTDSGPGTDAGPGGFAGCPGTLPADWIFCEDFETTTDPATVFFEYNDAGGEFYLVDTEGASGTHSMEVHWSPGAVGVGWISVAFGNNPITNAGSVRYRNGEDFTDIYWRLRVKHQAGWPDVGPAKLTRLTSFAYSNWGQAMVAHLWSQDLHLLGDPVSCVTGGTVDCMTYNDFGNFQWIGWIPGVTDIFSAAESGVWKCVEGHVTLNTPGNADGVFEFWIDGNYENGRSDLDWVGTWTDYGINLISIENYWNSGAVAELYRWIDDIVIAESPIGCN